MRRLYRKSFGHYPDYVLLGTVLFLVLVGLVFLSSASFDVGKLGYDDAYYFLKHQLLRGFVPGIVAFIIGYLVYYRRWRALVPFLFLINLILLALVFTPLGYGAHGSFRWLELGAFSFQPSELLKFTFIAYLASLFSTASMRAKRKKGWGRYGMFLLVSGVVAGLILAQPATTMAVIIICAGAVMYFLSGASFKHVVVTALLAVLLIGLLAMATPYRFSRIVPFWNKVVDNTIPVLHIDTEVDTFHLDQSLIAISGGGVFGVGFGKSTSKFSVLPEPMGDSIFVVIAEEVGFVGAGLVICAYLLFAWRGMGLVRRTSDEFGRLLLVGFVSVIAIQAVIHIAANTGILPFTGVPLPFVSYGGTSLVISLFLVGIMANISRHVTLR